MKFCGLLFLFLSVQVFAQTTILGEDFQKTSAELALDRLKAEASQINTSIIEQVASHQGGRLKPLDTLTRETLLYVTGKYERWGLNSNQIYLGLMNSNSSPWIEMIEVRDPEVRKNLGFLQTKRYISLADLEASSLNQKVGPIFEKQRENSKSLTPEEKSYLEVANQVSLMEALLTGEHLLSSLDFSRLTQGNPSTMDQTKSLVAAYLRAVKSSPTDSQTQAQALRDWSHSQKVPELFEHALGKLDVEIFYNRTQIFFWASLLYVLLGAGLLTPFIREKLKRNHVLMIFIAPLVLQAIGLGFRVYLTRFAPVTNMYGTMIWVSFGVNLFSLILYVLYSNTMISGAMLVISGLILYLTHSFPLMLSPDLDPIVAVLRNNFWLSTHVTTITISYAAFTIAMVLGNIALVQNIFGKAKAATTAELSRHAYRMVQLGCFLLTVGIILGGIWADYSWGRFWGWDPKETWALIADLGFLAILHARLVGWAPPFMFLAMCPVAYLMVVMAWYGVNFILAAGLHSYGFSSGGALAISIFVGIQVLVLAASLGIYYAKRPKPVPPPHG